MGSDWEPIVNVHVSWLVVTSTYLTIKCLVGTSKSYLTYGLMKLCWGHRLNEIPDPDAYRPGKWAWHHPNAWWDFWWTCNNCFYIGSSFLGICGTNLIKLVVNINRHNLVKIAFGNLPPSSHFSVIYPLHLIFR